MRVHLCGVRGSTPAPGIEFVRYGGATPCLALAHDGAGAPTLILDAGTGVQSVTGLLAGEPFCGSIVLTHLHWDHVLGLPFFAAADHDRAEVAVLLPEQAGEQQASAVLARVMSPPFFPIEPTQLRGQWTFASLSQGERQVQGFTVLAREIPHKGGRTFGYRVSDGRSTLTYMPDHCPTALGPGDDGLGAYHAAALELASEADLLVHDAQLLPAELAAEASFGHAAADYAVRLGERARARAVALFHHRHDRSDEALDELGRRLASVSPAVSVAAEGSVFEL